MAVAEGAKPVVLAEEQQERSRTALAETWRQFRRHKLAMLSLLFIIFLIFIAVTADLWQAIGFIDSPTYQHKGTNMAFAAPMTCSVDPDRQNPQWCFMSGTDQLGRDLFTRIVYGTRVSLLVGFIGAIVAMTVGLLYGVTSGYYGGLADNLMMRFIEFLNAIPGLPLIILLTVIFTSLYDFYQELPPLVQRLVDLDKSMGGLFFLFVALGLLSWTGVARLARGQVLAYKNTEFVVAARAIGARNWRIITAHLLPNILGPLILIGCLAVPGFIGTEAALSYLGLGVKAPTPSWGDMIAVGQAQVFGYPHMILLPTLMLALTILSFNFIADGLRDALDPSLRNE